MNRHSPLSLACFAAAGAWPMMVTALETALMSPYQQVLNRSICGAPLHASPEFLGHCAVCWVGSTILVAAGILLFLSKTDRRAFAKLRAN